jgi:hypothetical protein
MIRKHILAVLALAPAAAHAQLGALDAARGAGATSDAGNARIERAADAQLAEGEAQPRGARSTTLAPPAAPRDAAAAPIEGGAVAVDGGRGTVPPPDTYTVRPGDTLWDLSGRFLNNPWYWPKIWSYNPEIANPHWIEPGNVLKFYPSAEEAPGRVEPADPAAVATAPEEEEDSAEPVRAPALESFSRADLNAPVPLESDGVAVAGPFKVGYVPPRNVMARHDTFVTPHELAESGAITAAFDEKLMLTHLDRAYATFKGAAPVQKGETYVIYRTERAIQHPVTKELFGYQSVVLGSAQVVAVDEKAATLIIATANAPIERGALLGPWTDKPFRAVARRPNARDVDGLIIASPVGVLTQFAEHQVVFIDRGTADGVEEGNLFRVVRSGDLSGRRPNEVPNDPSLPSERVGDLLVIDAREHASAALVTRSLSELFVGDRVEMRSAVGSGGN